MKTDHTANQNRFSSRSMSRLVAAISDELCTLYDVDGRFDAAGAERHLTALAEAARFLAGNGRLFNPSTHHEAPACSFGRRGALCPGPPVGGRQGGPPFNTALRHT